MDDKPKPKTGDNWVRCKSKRGCYYMFNKTTGESYWEKSNASPTKTAEVPAINVKVKTPAQDRLKRLQTKIKENKTLKVPNSDNLAPKSVQSKDRRCKTNVIETSTERAQKRQRPDQTEMPSKKSKTTDISMPNEVKKNSSKGNKTSCTVTGNGTEKKKFKLPRKTGAGSNALKELQESLNQQPESSKPSESEVTSKAVTPIKLIAPIDRGIANRRLAQLRKSLQQQCAGTQFRSDASPVTTINAVNTSQGDDIEPMDWEPIFIPDNIPDSKINELTPDELLEDDASQTPSLGEIYNKINGNLLRLACEKKSARSWQRNQYYFVIDTCVLIDQLAFIDDIKKMKLVGTSGTIIYIPYIVLQELDKLKHRSTNESTKIRAIRAIRYLNENFKLDASNIQVQSAKYAKEELIEIDCPDDQIINCCLQLKKHVDKYILLTEDINLRNKAISNHILASSKSELLQIQSTKSTS